MTHRNLGGPLTAATLLVASVAWAGQDQPAAPQPPAPQAAPASPPAAEPPPDPQAILQGVCTSCHGVDFIAEHPQDRDDWDFTVHRMIDKGADLDPDDAALLIDYLAKTYPKTPPAPPPAPATPGR